MTDRNPRLPTVHQGGTAKSELVNAICDVRVILEDAIEKLRQTAPNGRDYIGRINGLRAANKLYCERLKTLEDLSGELYADAMAINESE